MKIIFDDGKEIEFDENEVALQDPREQIFKKDGIWYITKIINKDFAKWLDETKPMIIEEKKIPEKLNYPHIEIESSADDEIRDYLYKVKDKIDEIIDYLKSKGE